MRLLLRRPLRAAPGKNTHGDCGCFQFAPALMATLRVIHSRLPAAARPTCKCQTYWKNEEREFIHSYVKKKCKKGDKFFLLSVIKIEYDKVRFSPFFGSLFLPFRRKKQKFSAVKAAFAAETAAVEVERENFLLLRSAQQRRRKKKEKNLKFEKDDVVINRTHKKHTLKKQHIHTYFSGYYWLIIN